LGAPVKRRSYDSSRRQAQASETRSAIVTTARDLFIEQGYGRTTMTDIARAAGVSVETIYAAFGNKATLLHRAWDVTVGGDDQDIVFHERPEVMAIRNEPDLAKRLMLHAAFSTRTAQRIAPFQLMVQSAAGADPAAAAMLEEMGRKLLPALYQLMSDGLLPGRCRILGVGRDEKRGDVLIDGGPLLLSHRFIPNQAGSLSVVPGHPPRLSPLTAGALMFAFHRFQF